MKFSKQLGFGVVLLLLASGFLLAQDIPLHNWTVPPYAQSSHSGGITTMTDVTPPRAFIGVAPCRVADTRGNGAPIQGGIFPNSGLRTWDLTGICGLPAGTEAVSVNFTVVAAAGIPAGSFLLAFPTGTPPPPTAIMTYGPGQVISNAAIVPLGTGDQMNVNVSGSTHVIMDVNGYFADEVQGTAFGSYFQVITNTSGYAIYGQNTSTSCSGACGVVGLTSSDTSGSVGVYGSAGSATGFHYGVEGFISGSSAAGGAGVFGAVGAFPAGNLTPNTWNRAAMKAVGGGSNGLNAFSSGFNSAVSAHGADSSGNNLGNDAYLAWNEFGAFSLLANGNVVISGSLTVGGTKSFAQPHPTDATKQVRYISVEAPTADIYFRGTAQVSRGVTRIEVPESFRVVAQPGSYATIVTPVGGMATVAVMREDSDGIVLQASRDVRVHYVVHATREGMEDFQAIEPNTLFQPAMGTGYLSGLPEHSRLLMIRNGTLKEDGSVNLEKARDLGWKLPRELENRPESGTN
jgi:hypothetical protein